MSNEKENSREAEILKKKFNLWASNNFTITLNGNRVRKEVFDWFLENMQPAELQKEVYLYKEQSDIRLDVIKEGNKLIQDLQSQLSEKEKECKNQLANLELYEIHLAKANKLAEAIIKLKNWFSKVPIKYVNIHPAMNIINEALSEFKGKENI